MFYRVHAWLRFFVEPKGMCRKRNLNVVLETILIGPDAFYEVQLRHIGCVVLHVSANAIFLRGTVLFMTVCELPCRVQRTDGFS